MARSKSIFLSGLLAFCAFGQSSPVPTDVPYAVLVDYASIHGADGVDYTADGGVYLNDQARQVQKDVIKDLSDRNADLDAKLKAKDEEAKSNQLGAPAWVGITLSIIGTVGAAVATVVAAAHK